MHDNPHDALFKLVFSVPEHAAGELRTVLPAEVVSRISWETLRLLPGSFVDEDLTRSHTDLLFSAQVAGHEVLLYLLFEHLSTVEHLVPFRLFCYEARIWQDYLARHPLAKKLPPILPIVLHHSETGWRAETSFEEVLDVAPELRDALRPFLPRFRFMLDDVSHATDGDLRGRAMTALGKLALLCFRDARPAATLFRSLRRWLDLLAEVMAAPNGPAAVRAVLRYIRTVTRRLPDQEEIQSIMSNILRTPTGLYPPGSLGEQLIEYFHDDACRDVLLRLLKKRFGELSDATVTRVNAADSTTLDTWLDRILTATTLDEVLEGA